MVDPERAPKLPRGYRQLTEGETLQEGDLVAKKETGNDAVTWCEPHPSFCGNGASTYYCPVRKKD